MKNFVFFIFLSFAAEAAPPVDLSDLSDSTPSKPRVLRDEDIIFTDPLKKQAPEELANGKIALDVKGRASPQRKGKILVALKKNDWVKILKPSKDKRWVAIEVVASKRKVWVPASAVTKIIPQNEASKAPEEKNLQNP